MQPLMASDLVVNTAPAPSGGVGSVYQPTGFFPRTQTVPPTRQWGIPPASNFKAQEFPVKVYNRQAGGAFGNPLNVYAPNANSGSR